MTRPDPDELLVHTTSAELGRLRFAEHSLEALLQQVADVAARVVRGRALASITVFRQGHYSTAAASEPLATELDVQQYRHGEGPCMEAVATGDRVAVPDLRSAGRWPGFTAAAVERSVLSVVSQPLAAGVPVQAGLNLYAGVSRAGDERTERLIERLAGDAAVPIANMYLYRSAAERAEHLEVALDSRGVIDQAKGILMERLKLTPDQAFAALARQSMATNLRVREVAERLVRTGSFPRP